MKVFVAKYLKRLLRIAAFALGAGIAGLGAGSVLGMSAIQSAVFGALLAVVGLVGALSFIFSIKILSHLAHVSDSYSDRSNSSPHTSHTALI